MKEERCDWEEGFLSRLNVVLKSDGRGVGLAIVPRKAQSLMISMGTRQLSSDPQGMRNRGDENHSRATKISFKDLTSNNAGGKDNWDSLAPYAV